MHDGAVGPGAGDGRERDLLEKSGLAAEAFQRFDDPDFGQLAVRRFAVEPGEEARDRRAIAPVRGARALDLDRVLHRLEQRDRIGALAHLAAAVADETRERIGAGRLVEPHRLAGLAERREIAGKSLGRPHVGDFLEPMAHVVR